MKLITNSELQAFKRCRRKWWLTYWRRLRRRQQDVVGVRKIGSRLHEALRAYYSPSPRDPFRVLYDGVMRDAEGVPDWDTDTHKRISGDYDLARIMLEGYVEWLNEGGYDQGLKIVAAEERIEVASPGVQGVALMGKIDLRVTREIDEARFFLDHKTVGSFSQATATLHMDEQMLHYHLLEFLKALEVGEQDNVSDGAIYNMLRRVKRTNTAKPPFYERLEVRHNRHELRSYYTRVHGVIAEIMKVEERLAAGQDHSYVAYPSPRKECTWDCDFFDVCPMFDDQSDAEGYLAAYFEEADPHSHYEEEGEHDLE